MNLEELKQDAANLIVSAADFTSIAGLNASDCGIKLSASLFLNVRDAMFHFKALCDCYNEGDEKNFLRHYFNLKEHILRGEKDAIIFQVQAVCDAIVNVMQSYEFHRLFDAEGRNELQHVMHKMKNVILKLRISGADLSNDSELSVKEAWTEVANYTQKAVRICRDNNIPLF